MKLPRIWLALAAASALFAGLAVAGPVDGVLDSGYGPLLSVQSTQTSFGDQPQDWLWGCELDGAFGYIAGDTLHLLLTGSFNRFYSEPLSFAKQLQLFLDTGPGGQNPVSAGNPVVGYFVPLGGMTGMAFDAGFAPDYWIAGARDQHDRLYAYYAELPAGGGGAGYFLGASSLGGTGELEGANNPHGILASVDVSNSAGVTAGCAAASGAGVTTGIEWAIPLAAVGSPTGAIRICALIAGIGDGSNEVSNQLLGPVPAGTCALGPANAVDLETVPGTQYFVVDPATPTVQTTWGRLKSARR